MASQLPTSTDIERVEQAIQRVTSEISGLVEFCENGPVGWANPLPAIGGQLSEAVTAVKDTLARAQAEEAKQKAATETLNQGIQDNERRERELGEKKKKLSEKEKALEERQKGIDRKVKKLDKRETQLDTKQDLEKEAAQEIRCDRQKLVADRDSHQRGVGDFNQRRTDLEKREADLEKGRRDLQIETDNVREISEKERETFRKKEKEILENLHQRELELVRREARLEHFQHVTSDESSRLIQGE